MLAHISQSLKIYFKDLLKCGLCSSSDFFSSYFVLPKLIIKKYKLTDKPVYILCFIIAKVNSSK